MAILLTQSCEQLSITFIQYRRRSESRWSHESGDHTLLYRRDHLVSRLLQKSYAMSHICVRVRHLIQLDICTQLDTCTQLDSETSLLDSETSLLDS